MFDELTKSYRGPIRSVKGPSYTHPMAKKKETLKIGDKVYLVYKKYYDENITGARMYVCKVKTFENKQGKILPVLVEIGTKRELDPRLYYMSKDPEVAIKYLITKP
jgi:hypothetical protein